MDQKILWDCHMHSSFSADSDTPMEKMIQTAADKGLMGICFTEHFDPDYPDTPENLDFSLNIPAYRQKLESLADAFKNQIQVNFGIELGLQPQLAESFSDLLKEVPFDFVIGSSHVVHGYDPYYPSYFEGRKESACYMEYFESILENIAAFDEMDVYGHIDYVVRYGPNQNRQYSYGRYKEILDEILRTLIRKNVGIELNTGGYHYGLGEPNPCVNIIRRYRELGGEIITIGAVIRGNTSHYDYVCNEVSKGIASVSLETGVPVLFGVLTTENIEQAIERAGTKAGNKGYDCALSAIEMVNLIKELEA